MSITTIDPQSGLWDLATLPDRLFGRETPRTSMSKCALWTRAIAVQGTLLIVIACLPALQFAGIVAAVFFGPLAVIIVAGLVAAALEACWPYLVGAALLYFCYVGLRRFAQQMRLKKRLRVLWRRICPLVLVRT